MTPLIALFALGCGPSQDDDAVHLEDTAVYEDPYDITLAVSPEHAHVGDVLTFAFSVSLDTEPIDDLAPTCTYEQVEGGTADGDITLSATDPGMYVGQRALTSSGSYDIGFTFVDSEGAVQRSFQLTLEAH